MVKETTGTNGVKTYTVTRGNLKLEQSFTAIGKMIDVEKHHGDYIEAIRPGAREAHDLFIELHNWKIENDVWD